MLFTMVWLQAKYGTVWDSLNNTQWPQIRKAKPGVKPVAPLSLSTAEEQDLVRILLTFADIYKCTRKEVLNIVSRMLACKGVERVVGGGTNSSVGTPSWLGRTPATLNVSRARASTRECMDIFWRRPSKKLFIQLSISIWMKLALFCVLMYVIPLQEQHTVRFFLDALCCEFWLFMGLPLQYGSIKLYGNLCRFDCPGWYTRLPGSWIHIGEG